MDSIASEANAIDSITETSDSISDSVHYFTCKTMPCNNNNCSSHYHDVKFNHPNSKRLPLPWTYAAVEQEQELSIDEQHRFEKSKAQLAESSKISALLAGFTMICLVELQYSRDLPRVVLVVLGVVTALLVCIHLLALMISTCIQPFIEASRDACESPHNSLKFYINLAWFFSTFIGLILFLIEIGLIFYVKLYAIGIKNAGLITSVVAVPVLFLFIIILFFIYKQHRSFVMQRMDRRVRGLTEMLRNCDDHISFLKSV